MKAKNTQEALDLAEAREQALLDYINGEVPQDVAQDHDLVTFIDRAMYTRYATLSGLNGSWESFAVPGWHSNEIEEALRLDGVEDYTYTVYDEHFVYETVRVWFEGTKRYYREIAHGSSITVHLAPAGTLMDED